MIFKKSKLLLYNLFFLFLLSSPCFLFAQGDTLNNPSDHVSEVSNNIPKDPEAISDNSIGLTTKENLLGILLLLIMVITVIMEVRLVKDLKMKDDDAVKLIIVTIIVFGSIFLVVSGYLDSQLAPAFGLLGTISGYLLGKSEKGNKNDNNSNKE